MDTLGKIKKNTDIYYVFLEGGFLKGRGLLEGTEKKGVGHCGLHSTFYAIAQKNFPKRGRSTYLCFEQCIQ